MKAYTNIEQSKKLAEILSVESADGFYEAQHNPLTDKWEYILFTGNKWASEEVVIPCWSLAALLEALPTIDDGNRNPVACKDIRLNKWHVVYHGTAVEPTIDSGVCDNLIDACVEMILKLKEKD